jgi:hypothetical protein
MSYTVTIRMMEPGERSVQTLGAPRNVELSNALPVAVKQYLIELAGVIARRYNAHEVTFDSITMTARDYIKPITVPDGYEEKPCPGCGAYIDARQGCCDDCAKL